MLITIIIISLVLQLNLILAWLAFSQNYVQSHPLELTSPLENNLTNVKNEVNIPVKQKTSEIQQETSEIQQETFEVQQETYDFVLVDCFSLVNEFSEQKSIGLHYWYFSIININHEYSAFFHNLIFLLLSSLVLLIIYILGILTFLPLTNNKEARYLKIIYNIKNFNNSFWNSKPLSRHNNLYIITFISYFWYFLLYLSLYFFNLLFLCKIITFILVLNILFKNIYIVINVAFASTQEKSNVLMEKTETSSFTELVYLWYIRSAFLFNNGISINNNISYILFIVQMYIYTMLIINVLTTINFKIHDYCENVSEINLNNYSLLVSALLIIIYIIKEIMQLGIFIILFHLNKWNNMRHKRN